MEDVMKIVRTGYRDCRRVEGDGGCVIAMLMQYTSGFWAVHDMNDKKLTPAEFKSPTAAMKWLKEKA